MDMISSLPDNVRETILTYLPLKEAGRTSILSSDWRHTWNSIPELIIPYNAPPEEIEKLVDAILVLHEGPIRKFYLHTEATECPEAFDRWIHKLSRNGIRELRLDLNHGVIYKIPLSFFSCDYLSYVSLESCFLKLPVGFKGFKLLKTLELISVLISDGCIEKLVSCCPMLEDFMLQEFRGPDYFNIINIHAPNLRILDISGNFVIYKLWAPKLLRLYVNIMVEGESASATNFNQVLGGVPNLEYLDMRSYFINFISKGHVVGNIPLFLNLKEICIDLDFEEETDAKFIISLLQKTPNLEILNIEMFIVDFRTPPPKFGQWMEGKEFSFQNLQVFNITCRNCIEGALPFIKYVLRSAPSLLKLDVNHDEYYQEDPEKCLKQLMLLPRASMKAQINSE